ncbi:MAG: serine/threonine protein kinase, partial [Myxococcales bacterium]|nr:serine/threonine protein kinase [Myxococcales bacterium]
MSMSWNTSSASPAGDQLGRYQLLHRLAAGGMAELYLARTSGIEGFEKVVVLKRILGHLRGNDTFVSMFLDEARIAANLEHPNIVNVYDIGKAGDDYFFTMAYLHGEDLSALLRESARAGRGVPLPQALYIVQGVCAGLHYAHEQVGLDGQPLGIIHRDVSTTNVMVTYDGGVKLLDFGIAKAASQSQLTQVGVRKGKASYMSPEQCRADPLDRRSDVFSSGILLWELTTMRGLFRAENEMAVMNMIANKDAPTPSSVVAGYPAELERIVMRALARDPNRRYPSARALQDDLEQFVRDNRLGCSSGAMARLMRGLFGDKPLPWAAGGSLAMAGITLTPTHQSMRPSSDEHQPLGSEVETGAPSTNPTSSVEPMPSPSGVRAPLYAAAGALGAAAVGGVLW